MKSKARFVDHPLHPMLVHFPIAFNTAAAGSFIAYAVNAETFWFQVGYVATVAGVVTAIIAALPGIIDYFSVVPQVSDVDQRANAKRTGWAHMALNVLSLVLFAACALIYRDVWNVVESPDATAALYLSVIGALCTMAAGYLGGTLMNRYQIGVDLNPSLAPQAPVGQKSTTRVTPSPI